MLIRRLALPECVLLGRIPGTDHFASIVRHPDAQTVPGIVVFRPNAALLYFNADTVREHMLSLLERAEVPPRRIIVDLSFTTDLDLSTVRMLTGLRAPRAGEGVAVLPRRRALPRARHPRAREGSAALLGDLDAVVLDRRARRRAGIRRAGRDRGALGARRRPSDGRRRRVPGAVRWRRQRATNGRADARAGGAPSS